MLKQKDSGFSETFGGVKEEEYDFDALVFLPDSNGKVANLGRTANVNGDKLVFTKVTLYFNFKPPSEKLVNRR
jgi:hypothetical protein